MKWKYVRAGVAWRRWENTNLQVRGMVKRVRSGDLGGDNRNKLESKGCRVVGDVGLEVAEGSLRRARKVA